MAHLVFSIYNGFNTSFKRTPNRFYRSSATSKTEGVLVLIVVSYQVLQQTALGLAVRERSNII